MAAGRQRAAVDKRGYTGDGADASVLNSKSSISSVISSW
jgi:hypothetical protein